MCGVAAPPEIHQVQRTSRTPTLFPSLTTSHHLPPISHHNLKAQTTARLRSLLNTLALVKQYFPSLSRSPKRAPHSLPPSTPTAFTNSLHPHRHLLQQSLPFPQVFPSLAHSILRLSGLTTQLVSCPACCASCLYPPPHAAQQAEACLVQRSPRSHIFRS